MNQSRVQRMRGRGQSDVNIASAMMVMVDRSIIHIASNVRNRRRRSRIGRLGGRVVMTMVAMILVVIMTVTIGTGCSVGNAREFQRVNDLVLSCGNTIGLSRDHDGHAQAQGKAAQ